MKIAYLLLSLFVTSCGGNPSYVPTEISETVLMREDFTYVPAGWQTWHGNSNDPVTYDPVEVTADGVMRSTSLYPALWAVDRNHGEPGGLGDLNMVLHVCLQGNKYGCTSNAPNMDLRDAKLRARIRFKCCEGEYNSYGVLHTGPQSQSKTRLVWWFQSWNASIGKYVNMAAIGTPLDDDWNNGEWQTVEIAPQLNDWTCLGAKNDPHNSAMYGCDPTNNVIGNADIGTGLIYFPVDRNNVPVGRVEVDWIEIVK